MMLHVTRPKPIGARAWIQSRVFFTVALAVLLVASTIATGVGAAAGELDASFGNGGKVTTHFINLEMASAVALQPDGKSVAAGLTVKTDADFDFALARYNPDGSLDPSFGTGGKVTTDFFGHRDEAYGVAFEPDGGILVAGSTETGADQQSSDFAITRYKPDGSLDTTFGSGGKVVTDFAGGLDQARAILIQPDGLIVAAGFAGKSSGGSGGALARYNSDGSLDPSFGSSGRVTLDSAAITAIALQTNGRVVAAASSLMRFAADGSIDPSFGAGGILDPGFQARAVALLADGRIVAAGGSSSPNPVLRDFAVARCSADGILDLSFGTSGKTTTDIELSNDVAFAVGILPDGKIVAAGSSVIGDYNFALVRYSSDGILDSAFGSGGRVVTDFFGHDDQANAIAVAPDGRVLAAGYSEVDARTGVDFALARYMAGEAGGPDFALGFSQPTVTAGRGAKAKITVNLTRMNGFTGDVTVTPPDASDVGIITKSPEPIITSGATAKWKFKIKGGAETGPHQLTFTGKDDSGRVRTATITMVVE